MMAVGAFFLVTIFMSIGFLLSGIILSIFMQSPNRPESLTVQKCWLLALIHAYINGVMILKCMFAGYNGDALIMPLTIGIILSFILNTIIAANVLGKFSSHSFFISLVLFADLVPIMVAVSS